MERLKRLWDCYKEKSLDRLYNSISSNSSSTSAINNINNKQQANIINDAIIIKVLIRENNKIKLIVCNFSYIPFPSI